MIECCCSIHCTLHSTVFYILHYCTTTDIVVVSGMVEALVGAIVAVFDVPIVVLVLGGVQVEAVTLVTEAVVAVGESPVACN